MYRNVFVIILIILSSLPSAGYTNNFELKSLGDQEITLDQYQGNHLIIEGMTSWCETCKSEISVLKDIQQLNVEGLNIISIALDLDTDSLPVLENYRKKYEITWDMYLDHKQEFTDFYGIDNYPVIFLYDENGNLVDRWSGYTPKATIVKEIEDSMGIKIEDESSPLQQLLNDLTGNVLFTLFFATLIILILYKSSQKIFGSVTPIQR